MPTRSNPNEVSDRLGLASQIVNSGGHIGVFLHVAKLFCKSPPLKPNRTEIIGLIGTL
jgi:hypothetical protein